MLQFISVGVGGFFGAGARFGLTRLLNGWLPHFPAGTLASNLLAGLAIGLIVGCERHGAGLPGNVRSLLVVGLLGGLSTFSAFSLETVTFVEDGHWLKAGVNVALNVGVSLAAVVAGLAVAKLV
ncbi:MAG: CrcB family protein [Propionibacteriaceae bacterium]|jgi:CrcB protein|nr:CrcB family protein [Propionibacteriaceae bacterium]